MDTDGIINLHRAGILAQVVSTFHCAIPPADVLVVLAQRGVLTIDEARDALDRLRPAIRPAAYWEARQDLAIGG